MGISPDCEDDHAQMSTVATGNVQMQQSLGHISVEDPRSSHLWQAHLKVWCWVQGSSRGAPQGH